MGTTTATVVVIVVLVAAIATAVAIRVRASPHEGPAPASGPPVDLHGIMVDGLTYKVRYRVASKPNGKAIVFFPGWDVFGTGSYDYSQEPKLDPVVASGTSLVSLETPCDYNVRSGAFGFKLQELHLFGHSSGAFLVFRLCSRHARGENDFQIKSAVIYAGGYASAPYPYKLGEPSKYPPILYIQNPHDRVVPFAVTTKALTLSGSRSRRVTTTEPHVSPFPADRASDIVHFLM